MTIGVPGAFPGNRPEPSAHSAVTSLPREAIAGGCVAAKAHAGVRHIGRGHVHMTAPSLGKKRRIPIINALAAMMAPTTMTRKRVISA